MCVHFVCATQQQCKVAEVHVAGTAMFLHTASACACAACVLYEVARTGSSEQENSEQPAAGGPWKQRGCKLQGPGANARRKRERARLEAWRFSIAAIDGMRAVVCRQGRQAKQGQTWMATMG